MSGQPTKERDALDPRPLRNRDESRLLVKENATAPVVSRRAFVAYGALGVLGCSAGPPDDRRPAEARPRDRSGEGQSQSQPPSQPSRSASEAPTDRAPRTAATSDERDTETRTEPRTALPPALDTWLRASAVLSQRPHTAALRTWTTPQQGREIERGQVLTRSHAADLSRSFFDQLMARRRRSDPLAELLSSRPWQRARYAWPHAWATAHGLHGTAYGSVLATLHLRDDALWLGYSAAAPDTWTLHDASETPLTGVDPREVASRIAGVFFEATPLAAAPHRARNTELPGWGPWGMREYIVRNPDAIARVTVDDASERAAHAQNLARLTELGAFCAGRVATGEAALPPRYGELAARTWQAPEAARESWQVRFARALAIATPTYAPKADALLALAAPPVVRPAARPAAPRQRPPTRPPRWDIT